MPTWSKGQPDAKSRKQRVTDIIRRYGGKISSGRWSTSRRTWTASRSTSRTAGPAQADPKAYLIVNDYYVLADGCPPFFELLQKAKAERRAFRRHRHPGPRAADDAVPAGPRSRDVLDQYAALGKDLHITEFTPTSGGEPITGSPADAASGTRRPRPTTR